MSINILRIKNMKTRNIADITHQWCLQMRAKAFDSRVGWGALNVLPRNGVSFLENEICILNIKSIFAHRKYFLYTFSKTWKVFGWRLTIVQEENNILVWNIISNCDLWRSKSRKNSLKRKRTYHFKTLKNEDSPINGRGVFFHNPCL